MTPTAVVCCANSRPNTAMPIAAQAICHLRSKRSAKNTPISGPIGVGDGDDEGVGERLGDVDALRDQKRRHPAGEAVIADGLEQIVDHQHDGAAAIGRVPHLAPGAGLDARLRPSTVSGGGSSLPVSARILSLQLGDDPFGLGDAAVLREPARRFRQAAPDPPDHDRADRADNDDPAPAVEAEDRHRHQVARRGTRPPARR